MKKKPTTLRTANKHDCREDATDLADLRAAIKRNKKKSGLPWKAVKKELGLD